MEIKTIYIANDGKEFDNEKECFDYEHRFDNIVNSDVKFWDCQRRPIDKGNIQYCIEASYVMYVPNQEIAKELQNTFDYFGVESPWSETVEDFDIGYFYYENTWINIDKEIASLKEIITSLK